MDGVGPMWFLGEAVWIPSLVLAGNGRSGASIYFRSLPCALSP